MATQWTATNVANYTTNDRDRTYLYHEAGIWWVAFTYIDQSPQFIRCETPEEAKRLYATSLFREDRAGTLKYEDSRIDLTEYSV